MKLVRVVALGVFCQNQVLGSVHPLYMLRLHNKMAKDHGQTVRSWGSDCSIWAMFLPFLPIIPPDASDTVAPDVSWKM